jgi:phage-related holin
LERGQIEEINLMISFYIIEMCISIIEGVGNGARKVTEDVKEEMETNLRNLNQKAYFFSF